MDKLDKELFVKMINHDGDTLNYITDLYYTDVYSFFNKRFNQNIATELSERVFAIFFFLDYTFEYEKEAGIKSILMKISKKVMHASSKQNIMISNDRLL